MFAEKNALKELKALEASFSCAGGAIIGALLHAFDRQSVRLLAAIEEVGIFVFHLVSPVTNGTISLTTLRIGERPVCCSASVPSGLGPVTGGVVFSSCQNCSIKRTH
jgi:hypothetical protein